MVPQFKVNRLVSSYSFFYMCLCLFLPFRLCNVKKRNTFDLKEGNLCLDEHVHQRFTMVDETPLYQRLVLGFFILPLPFLFLYPHLILRYNLIKGPIMSSPPLVQDSICHSS